MASRVMYYLRVRVDEPDEDNVGADSVEVRAPFPDLEMTFVDLCSRNRSTNPPRTAELETLSEAVQNQLHRCSQTDTILFRWPWLVQRDDESHRQQIRNWLSRLTENSGGEPVISGSSNVGVLQHRVGGSPILEWSSETFIYDYVLAMAREIELSALLKRGNAVWKPPSYHFRLPSGEHTDTFIRIAEAIRQPQDAYVLTCWLTENLKSGAGIVVDTGGLTPLLIQIESFLARFGFEIGPSVVLNEYPAGRAAVRSTLERALTIQANAITAVMSVSATGGLQRTMLDELDRLVRIDGTEYSFDVLVDRSKLSEKIASGVSNLENRSNIWLSLNDSAETTSSGSCEWCSSAEKAQLVAVDPRSYGATALPLPKLVMPNVDFAIAGQHFWERAGKFGARSIEVKPHPKSMAARGKRMVMPVRPIFEVLCQKDGLEEMVRERYEELAGEIDFLNTGLVIALDQDLATSNLPEFAGEGQVNLQESLRVVLTGVGIGHSVPVVSVSDLKADSGHAKTSDPRKSILLFSWGSVTGVSLRRMKVAVAEVLSNLGIERTVNALVFHGRASNPSEWSAQENQFRPGMLMRLWESCYPWASPLREELQLLDRTDLKSDQLSPPGKNFLKKRRGFLGQHGTFATKDDDWSPRFNLGGDNAHPEHVFWGMSRNNVHQKKVRGRSLYGSDLDCLSAYAAMGSVIHYTRQIEQPEAAPRWVMFDLGRIVRSYFDAVIICSILRWLQPGELWWAMDRDEPEAVSASVQFLLDQTEDRPELVLLVPELLLAAAQGKVPKAGHNIILEKGKQLLKRWREDPDLDEVCGALEVGSNLLTEG